MATKRPLLDAPADIAGVTPELAKGAVNNRPEISGAERARVLRLIQARADADRSHSIVWHTQSFCLDVDAAARGAFRVQVTDRAETRTNPASAAAKRLAALLAYHRRYDAQSDGARLLVQVQGELERRETARREELEKAAAAERAKAAAAKAAQAAQKPTAAATRKAFDALPQSVRWELGQRGYRSVELVDACRNDSNPAKEAFWVRLAYRQFLIDQAK